MKKNSKFDCSFEALILKTINEFHFQVFQAKFARHLMGESEKLSSMPHIFLHHLQKKMASLSFVWISPNLWDFPAKSQKPVDLLTHSVCANLRLFHQNKSSRWTRSKKICLLRNSSKSPKKYIECIL